VLNEKEGKQMEKVYIQVIDAQESIEALASLGINAVQIEAEGADEIEVDYDRESNVLKNWMLDSGWDEENADYILNGD
jgi:hypothetical protein